MSRLVLAHCASGLGNRLKCLITAQRVAADMGVGLRIYWEVNRAVASPLKELFVNDLETVNAQDAIVLAADSEVITVRTWRLWPSYQDPIPADYRPPYPSPHRQGLDFAYHRIPPAVRDSLIPWFSALRPHSAIRDAVDSIFSSHPPPTVGMAVRTWVDAPERGRLFDLRSVSALVAGCAEPISVTSDTRTLVNDLVARYPDKVITSAGHLGSLRGAQPALCDLLAVARCPRMFVSLGSTFSEVAWWLGGARAAVEVIAPRRYWFNAVDLGEVAGYALAGRWWFKNKGRVDAMVTGAWRRLGL